MKIRILGCGTSSGVPRIGNDWGRCDSKEPRNRRLRSSILLYSEEQVLLVDCGPDLHQQLNDAGRGLVDRVIVTHDHADHTHGIDELRQVAHAVGRPVPLLARADVLDRLSNRFAYAFRGTADYPAVLDGQVVPDEMLHGAARLRFVDQPHGRITSIGVRIDENARSAVYAIDFHDLTQEMASLYRGVDLWISDCLRVRPHPSHAHLDAVLGWARDLGVGQLLLSHLDNSMDYAELVRTLPSWAAPAHDGLEITL